MFKEVLKQEEVKMLILDSFTSGQGIIVLTGTETWQFFSHVITPKENRVVQSYL